MAQHTGPGVRNWVPKIAIFEIFGILFFKEYSDHNHKHVLLSDSRHSIITISWELY